MPRHAWMRGRSLSASLCGCGSWPGSPPGPCACPTARPEGERLHNPSAAAIRRSVAGTIVAGRRSDRIVRPIRHRPTRTSRGLRSAYERPFAAPCRGRSAAPAGRLPARPSGGTRPGIRAQATADGSAGERWRRCSTASDSLPAAGEVDPHRGSKLQQPKAAYTRKGHRTWRQPCTWSEKNPS